MAAERHFLDTNVLIYATDRSSPFHASASATIKQLTDSGAQLYVSGQVLREYLTVATNLAAIKANAQSLPAIIANYREFSGKFEILEESESSRAILLDLISKHPVSGKKIHDYNIVAVMISHGVSSLVTNNTGDFKNLSFPITLVVPSLA